MRSSHAARISTPLSRFISILCAVTLCCGLVPSAALAAGPDSLPLIPEGDEGVVSIASSAEGGDTDGFSHCASDEPASADGGDAATPLEDVTDNAYLNQEVALDTLVAQTESTKTFFLAETLESTRTVPVVSAKLPLDTGDEENEPIASIVVGSFEYLGMTFAIEAGGQSVALVAADYSKLPQEFIEKQVLVIPDMATADGVDYYSVTRIADNAFSSFKKNSANPDYVGCEALLSDEELYEGTIAPSSDDALMYIEGGGMNSESVNETDGIINPLADCMGILALYIPASVKSIEGNSFADFETLQYIVVSRGNPNYVAYNGVLYGINDEERHPIFISENHADPTTDSNHAIYSTIEKTVVDMLKPVAGQNGNITSPFVVNQSADLEFRSAYNGCSWTFRVIANGGYFTLDKPTLTTHYLADNTFGAGKPYWRLWSSGAITLYTNDTYDGDVASLQVVRYYRTGYTFTGWTGAYTLSAGDKFIYEGLTYANPLYCNWKQNTYTISLYPNGEGASVSSATVNATYDANVTLPTPTWSGHKFLGWNTEEDGSGTSYSAGANTKPNMTSTANGNVKLYAQWESLLFEASWQDRGETIESETILCGDPVTMLDALEERPAYTFEGWKASTNGTVYAANSSDFTMPASAVAFIAVWKLKSCAVAFDSGVGTENLPVVVPSPDPTSPFTMPTPVRREGGEVFSHWGISDDDQNNLWYPGGSLTIEGILAGGYPEADVLETEEIDGTTYHNVITLHAVWNPMISVQTPLVVTMAIDPDTGEMIAGEGYISTTGTSEVSVLSLAYDKTDPSSLGGGTNAVFGGDANGISLTMASVRDDASDIESAFESASPFALDLDAQDGIPVTDSTLSAFPKFGNGVSLRIRYGLSFPAGFDISSLASSLPDKADTEEGSSWSRESYPIANLHYTVGLVH